jgi:hypothetical protein
MTLVVLLASSLALGAVVVAPTSAAHYCRGTLPSDCGPCTSGDHDHTYCNSHTLDILKDIVGNLEGPVLA